MHYVCDGCNFFLKDSITECGFHVERNLERLLGGEKEKLFFFVEFYFPLKLKNYFLLLFWITM